MRFSSILAGAAALGATFVAAQVKADGNLMGTRYPPVCGNECGPIFVSPMGMEYRVVWDTC